MGSRDERAFRPRSVEVVASDGRVAVSWDKPESNGNSDISMYTATAAPGGATCTSETDRRGCIITGLTNGTEYVVSVTATNTAVGEGPGASSQVVVPSVLAPRLIGEYGGADNNAGIALAMSEDGARTAIRTGDGVEVIAWNEGIGDFELVGSPITDMDLATNMEVQAVDISNDGNRLAIGDWAATNSSDVFSGIVKVFDWDENVEDWVQAGSTLEGSISQEDFGYAVDLSGDGSRLAVVAADTNNSAGVGLSTGCTNGMSTSTWSQIGQDIDRGGLSTALSFDGEVLIVGHDESSDSTGTETNGSVSAKQTVGRTLTRASALALISPGWFRYRRCRPIH